MPIIQPDLERHKVSGVENSPKYNHVYHKIFPLAWNSKVFYIIISWKLTFATWEWKGATYII